VTQALAVLITKVHMIVSVIMAILEMVSRVLVSRFLLTYIWCQNG
jgi:hypothetical protein